MSETIIKDATMVLTAIGGMAFIVSVIVQVTKGVGVLAHIPTDLETLVVSLALPNVAVVVESQINNHYLHWWHFVAATIAGFCVAFVAMYGWEKASALFKRLVDREEVDDDA